MIKPERLTWNQIRDRAEEVRSLVGLSDRDVPVDMVAIVEIRYGLQVVPVADLQSETDIESFLTSDQKTIYIDKQIYWDPRYENRLRFTYAHELGHLVLHEAFHSQAKFQNPAEWVKFRHGIDEDDLNWFEQQAYEFGGRFLVPKTLLMEKVREQKYRIDQFYELSNSNAHDAVIGMVARVLSSDFGVSEGVLVRRICGEKIWEELGYR